MNNNIMSVKELYIRVNDLKEQLEWRILNRKGKVRAKHEARVLIDELGLYASSGVRDSYTMYYVSHEQAQGAVGLAINYTSNGTVKSITTH